MGHPSWKAPPFAKTGRKGGPPVDNNGNTVSKTDSNGVTSYTWDYENRLTSVTLPGAGGTVTFNYDPFGRRVQESGTSVVNYVYDGANVVAEYDSAGNLIAHYDQGAGVDEPLAMSRTAALSFFQADGLGSITSLSDGNGAISDSYQYDAFGNISSSTGTVVNSFRYTGREWDAETGLYYYRARYYDPSVGRFISDDPIGFEGGNNFYAYVSNRPTMLTDPTGLAQCLYEVGKGMLTCISSTNPFGSPQIQINASSGLGRCKNNNQCHLPYLGPIEPGKYQMNKDPRPGHEFWYRLEPLPHIPGWKVRLGLERGGFALHLGTFSEGCINVDMNDPIERQKYLDLLNMLDAEQGDNFLYAVP